MLQNADSIRGNGRRNSKQRPIVGAWTISGLKTEDLDLIEVEERRRWAAYWLKCSEGLILKVWAVDEDKRSTYEQK